MRNALRWRLGRGGSIPLQQALALEFHGTDYGGWSLLQGSVKTGSLVYSFGIGEDASFDLSLIRRYGCTVHAFDPTPKSVRWVKQNVQDALLLFHPIALAAYDGQMRLYLPRNPGHVSASVLPGAPHLTNDHIEVPCSRFDTLRKSLGHARVDILKMDIEGAEYSVIKDLTSSGAISSIGQLLIEFHRWDTVRPGEIRDAVRRLNQAGMWTTWVSDRGSEVLFARAGAP